MSAIAATGTLHVPDNPSQSPSNPSPASPTSSFQNQQSSLPRSFINLNPPVRGQSSPFPTTPISSHMNGFFDPPAGVNYRDFIRTWTDSHVARWLSDIKCGTHAATFRANDIRGDILLELDQVTLKEMGVSSVGDRLRIVNAVKALRQKSAARCGTTPVLDAARPTRLNTEYGSDTVNGLKISERQDSSPTTRLASRRLESGRPAPLQLNASSGRNDLPRLVREQPTPDSARLNPNPSIRPLPHPTQITPVQQPTNSSVNTPNNTHIPTAPLRPNLPPLPPPPRGQPPLPPPSRAPARSVLNGASQLSGRRTPTQADTTPAYTTLLPAGSQNQNLLTPSSASNWSGYHLPVDPRPGNLGGGKTPAITRSTSPLPPGRGSRPAIPNPAHGRNGSLSTGSPNPSNSPNKLPLRPSTSNSHPYANAQPALQPPATSQQAYNLSPIAESFMTQHSSTSGSPSPPSNAYSVSRGPFNPNTPSHTNAPSLDDLRRKLVKFILPDEGLSFTIDVDTCVGGIEVLEKVLKKFGKGGSRSADSEGSVDHVQSDEGGLSVDGWGVYLDWGQEDGPGQSLTEAELLCVCHAPPDHPAREHGLTLRRTVKARRHDDRNGNASPTAHGKYLGLSQAGKNTKRASSISILSGLGVDDPEKALDPPSPTQAGRGSPAAQSAKRPSKLRNFFGQRPPSELITTHLTEYFPFTEKKVLERTARHSMMRNTLSFNKRDSAASWNPPLLSRFSSSTQGSQSRMSISPTRTSISSIAPPQLPDKTPQPDNKTSTEEIPRMSLSTDDGRSVELHGDDVGPDKQPQLLPPIPFLSESLGEALESITGGQRTSRPTSRVLSSASRRLSYITELRSKRDRSDTASLMTVDEITAEVESRRESMAIERGSDADDWTKVDSEGIENESVESTLNVAEEEFVEELDDETTLNDEDDGPDLPVKSRGTTKWIKGALIGAGSFGKVYLGMDATHGLLMAVKQVELPTGSAPNQERKKSMLSALEREIELLKDLQHENIVQYLYSSIEDDYLNIFLEYVPGGSVTALLRNYGAFEETLVKNFVRQILEGLNYLHERDIIHRDIKGANILVDNKGGIKISDFGISKKVEDNLLTGNRVHRPSLQGSVFWMAPEVVKQSGHTRKADIWSVGCLVVEMLTGEHPWAQLTQMQAIFKIGSSAIPTIPSDVTPECQDFLQRTFEIDHEARPSAFELLQHPWVAKKPVNFSSKGNLP